MKIKINKLDSKLRVETLKTHITALEKEMNLHLINEIPSLNLITKSATLNVFFVTDETIKGTNQQRRNKDKPTDVLSWKLYEEDINDNMIFGEILISDDYVVSQAKAKDKELAEEIAFLLTHGFLHICGHTHENDTDEAKMNAATDKILKKIGIDYYKDII